ncbi:MAG: FtsX-like permease family protein [Acidobacteriota bacterium]
MAGELKEQQLTASAGSRRRLLAGRHFPVLAETALALTLLIAAGLFMRGALQAADTDPGFDLEGGLLAEVDTSLAGMRPDQGRQLYLDLLNRLRALPGAESASLAGMVPFGTTRLGQRVEAAGAPSANPQGADSDDLSIRSGFNIIGADYFATIGLPLLRGRSFTRAEEQPSDAIPVAVINQALARRLWPEDEALGGWIRFPSRNPAVPPREMEVVGVVANFQDSFFSSELRPHVYIPFGAQYQSNMHFPIKAKNPAPEAVDALLATVQKEIRSAAPSLPIIALKSFRRHLDESIHMWAIRSGAQVFLIFGGLALFLAMVGVYGVRAYSVARRTREIGIRMALGSTRSETLWLVLRECLKLTLAGSLLGLALALAVAQLIAGFTYNVEPTDAAVFLSAPLILTAVSLLACYLPARRAARVDPAVALRNE